MELVLNKLKYLHSSQLLQALVEGLYQYFCYELTLHLDIR